MQVWFARIVTNFLNNAIAAFSFQMKSVNTACVCESGKPYAECCAPYHAGTPAPNAEALMRSRYSAYVLGFESYVLSTWHPDKRPISLNLDKDPPIKWLGLQVKRSEQRDATHALVEFVARYKLNGKGERLHEISTFVKVNDAWYYLNGVHK